MDFIIPNNVGGCDDIWVCYGFFFLTVIQRICKLTRENAFPETLITIF
jgi:hypothetical protein